MVCGYTHQIQTSMQMQRWGQMALYIARPTLGERASTTESEVPMQTVLQHADGEEYDEVAVPPA